MAPSDFAELRVLITLAVREAEKRLTKRIAQCEGKEKFPTWELAAKAAKRCTRNSDQRRSVYHCGHCGYFHTGSRSEFWKRRA